VAVDDVGRLVCEHAAKGVAQRRLELLVALGRPEHHDAARAHGLGDQAHAAGLVEAGVVGPDEPLRAVVGVEGDEVVAGTAVEQVVNVGDDDAGAGVALGARRPLPMWVANQATIRGSYSATVTLRRPGRSRASSSA